MVRVVFLEKVSGVWGSRVGSLGIQFLGFRFWVLGFGFWVLGFGFWVWDLGLGFRV
jgi:hypothetical protein